MSASSAADFPYFTAPPVGLAHRGGMIAGPAATTTRPDLENTMVAFAAAVELGFRYLETDVHATSDGVLVAFHDTTLDRVTDATGVISRLPWSTVQQARIGGLEPIPTLADVLTRWPDVRINIDIKSSGAIRLLWDCIVEYEAFDRVCVGSFSDRRLGAFRRLARGQVATAAGPRETAAIRFLSDRLARRATARAQVLQIPETIRLRGKVIHLVTPELLARAHNAGMQVHVWTINDADDMRRLFDLGVDGIVSDRIDLLADVLAERGAWPPAR